MTNYVKASMITRLKNKIKIKLRSLLAPKLAERAENPFATHIPVIIGLSQIFTIRNVLELGCGEYSTMTFLNKSVFPDLEKLDSFETDSEWFDKISTMSYKDSRLDLRLVREPLNQSLENVRWNQYDLIFVDDSTNATARSATIEKVVQNCSPRSLILVHDYEVHEYQIAAKYIPFKFVFTALNPNTGLVRKTKIGDFRRLKDVNNIIKDNVKNISLDDVQRWVALMSSQGE